MRLIFGPLAVMHISICIALLAHTVHHALLEFTYVTTLIGPSHFTHATGLIFFKLSLVDFSSVGEIVLASSVEHAVEEFSLISTTFASERAHSALLAAHEIAFILNLVVIPILRAFSMLLIFVPLALVETSLRVAESSFAVSHTIFPLSLIDVSIRVSHPPVPVKLAIHSLSLIHSAVRILDSANAGPPFFARRLRVICLWLLPLAKIRPALADVLLIVVPDQSLLL